MNRPSRLQGPFHDSGMLSLVLIGRDPAKHQSPVRDEYQIVVVTRVLGLKQREHELRLLTSGGFNGVLIEDGATLHAFLTDATRLQATGAILVDYDLGWGDESYTSGAEVIQLLYQLDYRGVVLAAPAGGQKVETIKVCEQQDELLRAGARGIARWTDSIIGTLRSALAVQRILFPYVRAAA